MNVRPELDVAAGGLASSVTWLKMEGVPAPMPASEPSWTLMVPFTVASELKLTAETTETVDGITLRVRPREHGFNEFVFDGLESVGHARQRFGDLRAGVLAAGLYIGGGVRIGRDLMELDSTAEFPSGPGQAIVYPTGCSLRRMTIYAGPVSFQTDKVLPRFMEGLRVGLSADQPKLAMEDPKVQLASLLYSDSYFETSLQARLIGFVGVLEVLKDQEAMPAASQELVDRWISEVGATGASDAQSLRQRLHYLRSISIGQGIRSLVRRHLGDAEARAATKIYAQRSQLIHDGITPDDLATTVRMTASLVARLLVHILSTGQR